MKLNDADIAVLVQFFKDNFSQEGVHEECIREVARGKSVDEVETTILKHPTVLLARKIEWATDAWYKFVLADLRERRELYLLQAKFKP